MASVPHTTSLSEIQAEMRPEDSVGCPIAELPLFRYGLKQFLVFVAAMCALFAAVASMSGIAAAIFLLTSSVVVMHVFATALGSRLRARTDDEQRRRHAQLPDSDAPRPGLRAVGPVGGHSICAPLALAWPWRHIFALATSAYRFRHGVWRAGRGNAAQRNDWPSGVTGRHCRRRYLVCRRRRLVRISLRKFLRRLPTWLSRSLGRTTKRQPARLPTMSPRHR